MESGGRRLPYAPRGNARGEKGKDRKKTSGGEDTVWRRKGGKKTIGEDNRERAKDKRRKR